MKKIVMAALGFLITPLFAITLHLTIDAILYPSAGFFDHLGWIPIFYPYALIFTGLVALPLYLLLIYYDNFAFWSAIFMGTFTALFVMLVLRMPSFWLIVVGVLSGLLFWMIESLGGRRNSKEDKREI
jgi:hypothetical protein